MRHELSCGSLDATGPEVVVFLPLAAPLTFVSTCRAQPGEHVGRHSVMAAYA
jgi:hypothetical protein